MKFRNLTTIIAWAVLVSIRVYHFDVLVVPFYILWIASVLSIVRVVALTRYILKYIHHSEIRIRWHSDLSLHFNWRHSVLDHTARDCVFRLSNNLIVLSEEFILYLVVTSVEMFVNSKACHY